jgi:adenine-specific DNA-methyltransferase
MMARLREVGTGAAQVTRKSGNPSLPPGAEAAGPIIKEILSEIRGSPSPADPLRVCLDLLGGRGPSAVTERLIRLSPAWRDHAIASIYAVLMPSDRRKRLGAYFTPPHLVDHLVDRLQALGLKIADDRLRDPAAGGAAFLVPLARRKIAAWRAAGVSEGGILARLPKHLRGQEIDADLAQLANALLRQMLTREFAVAPHLVADMHLVVTGDSLADQVGEQLDVEHEIGNPPYLRLAQANDAERQAEFSDIANGRLNLYTMFLRRALDRVPPGGLVGYVVPASFLGGPEFRIFRSRIVQLAEVLVVDLIEKRSDVFLDATQDACFVVLRRRMQPDLAPKSSVVLSGILKANCVFETVGTATVEPDGEPWRLPGSDIAGGVTLLGWGYKGRIGYLVANRQPERLHVAKGEGCFPLIWAKAISGDGEFDFARGVEHKGLGWVDAPATAPYIVREECVAIQRTSSRGQRRRLAAALIPRAFVEEHGGVVAENHVILLVRTRADAKDAQTLVDALNAPQASEQLDRVCGSASISVRLLEKLKFGTP